MMLGISGFPKGMEVNKSFISFIWCLADYDFEDNFTALKQCVFPSKQPIVSSWKFV